MTSTDLKKNILRRIAANINSDNKVGEIDQNFSYFKLKYMNIPSIIDIYNGKPLPEGKIELKIARKSYEMLLENYNKINVPELFITNMMKSLEEISQDLEYNMSVCSILLKTSRDQIYKIIKKEKGIYIPHVSRNYLTSYQIDKSYISGDQLGTLEAQFEQIVNKIVNKGLFFVDVGWNDIIYIENKLIVFDVLESVFTVAINSTVKPIPKDFSDYNLVKLFMKFQIFMTTNPPIFSDIGNIFIKEINNFINFLNIPGVKQYYKGLENTVITDVEFVKLFMEEQTENEEDTSKTKSLIITDYMERFNVTRVKKHYWSGISKESLLYISRSDISQILDIPTNMTILESINISLLENVYNILSRNFEEIMDGVFNVHYGTSNDFYTISTQRESIGVYVGDEKTVMTLDGKRFEVKPGHAIITNLDIVYVKFDDCNFVWYY